MIRVLRGLQEAPEGKGKVVCVCVCVHTTGLLREVVCKN